jgi:hypothetical protein
MSMFRLAAASAVAAGLLSASVASAAPDLRVPTGTTIPVRFQTGHSSASSHPEERVVATVRQNVLVRGQVAIPAGSELRGHVVSVQRPGRVRGQGYIAVDFDKLTVRGRTYDIALRQLAVLAPRGRGRDAKVIGGGAGVGAIVGAIADGGEGAAKGALIGGAAGTGAVLATRGKDAYMPAGSRWRLRLDRPILIVR